MWAAGIKSIPSDPGCSGITARTFSHDGAGGYSGTRLKIIGYHTLVYGETLHIAEKSKLYPSFPERLPVLTLARMAVDKRHQGKRLGEQLLLDSIRRTAIAYDVAAPVIGLFVDAKDDNVRDFYEKYGFEVVNESANGLYLWLPINSCLSIEEELA